MVTKEQFYNGTVNYIDNYVMPPLSTKAKWIIGGTVALINPNNVIEFINSIPMLKTLNVVDSNGMINVCKIADAFSNAANKYGKISLCVPFTSEVLGFGADDIQQLKACIEGA